MEYKCSNCGNNKYKTIENQGGVFLICQECGYVNEIVPRDQSQPQPKQPSNQVHCPYCNSTNVNKLSSTKKAMSIIGFGILSNKIGKQWHCNNCKSDF